MALDVIPIPKGKRESAWDEIGPNSSGINRNRPKATSLDQKRAEDYFRDVPRTINFGGELLTIDCALDSKTGQEYIFAETRNGTIEFERDKSNNLFIRGEYREG